MKNHKKLLLGLGLIMATLLSGLFLKVGTVKAEITNPQPQKAYLDSCVSRVAPANNYAGGNLCRFFQDGLLNTDVMYGNGALEVSALGSLGFKVGYSASGYSASSPPSPITLINTQTNELFFQGNNALAMNNFIRTGGPFTAETTENLYFTYTSQGDPDYRLLLGFRSDGKTPYVFALANIKVVDCGNASTSCPNTGVIYGYKLGVNVITSTPTGGVTPADCNANPNDPRCSGSGGATSPKPDDCYTLGSLGLEWFFCAVLEGIDKAVTSFYDAVQNQLCIQVDSNSINSVTAGSTGCGEKPNNFTPAMHDAWSSMRVIATSLLVVLMLIAIIGQAVGGGRGT